MLKFSYLKYSLQLAFNARTSRGTLESHDAYFIKVYDHVNPAITGWGEASPLKGLSVDGDENFEHILIQVLEALNVGESTEQMDLIKYPALHFGLEMALLDLTNGGKRELFDSPFIKSMPIEINGLIWMSDIETMLKEVDKKIAEGFTCLKFKIGAHDFDEECRMLEHVRKKYSLNNLEIRLDANGSLKNNEALNQLKELLKFNIHSVEQPVAPGQADWMQEICAKSSIKIVLDEELIGVDVLKEGKKLLQCIKPAFIIIKPTLLGGFSLADKWLELATQNHIGWWATSALESNIGLNAIAQWCSTKNIKLPQGLGTGSLYTNNIKSPLSVHRGRLIYTPRNNWELPFF
ncbi:MAG: o-succinylbenzoate synthase [Bacteroidota bacterium]|nr:o-succinylbenzoate synthase [Bacteroidota bacterium]